MQTYVQQSDSDATAEFLARLPRRSPADLVALARQQGKSPVARFEDLLGPENMDEDEFDVDAFLAARNEWQAAEGRFVAQRGAPDTEDE